jgi:hypothetical protein
MSKVGLIIGESGAGKSTAIRTLNPKETFIINSLGKDLPFKGSGKSYTYYNKDTNPSGNMVKTTNATAVIQWLNFISQKMPHIKTIIIDDNTHQSSMEFIRRIKEKDWEKFNDIASNMTTIAELSKSLREDLVVFIMHHVQVEGDGILEDKKYKAMTIGKLVDNKLSGYESLFTIVFFARKEKNKESGEVEYFFLTRDADSTAKTPIDMFAESKIPNDLSLVRESIIKYYDEQ